MGEGDKLASAFCSLTRELKTDTLIKDKSQKERKEQKFGEKKDDLCEFVCTGKCTHLICSMYVYSFVVNTQGRNKLFNSVRTSRPCTELCRASGLKGTTMQRA